MLTETGYGYKIGNRIFSLNGKYVMGILNVTPDSFSDGGKYFSHSDAVKHAFEMINEGADIIDVGGESTRPGSDFVSADEELRRVIPVIEKIISEIPDTIISVDTNKSVVAREALKAGAKIVNDISAGTFDAELLDTAASFDAAVILMHIKGTPKNMQEDTSYTDVCEEVKSFLLSRAEEARRKGIDKIFIDPGIGFGKTADQNFSLISKLPELRSTGIPVAIGVSRKSFLGKLLGLQPYERENATVITETIAMLKGANIIRTHNVKNAIQAVRIVKEISAEQNV
ncbi:MAG: dihydropteroate synthase [Ignavibacteriaceae bacterium]